MRLLIILVAGLAIATGTTASAALFYEDFNDGNAASRWSVVSQQEGVVGPDGSVDFNFDYSTLGIANPNGSSDTTGVFLQFNKNDDGPVNEGESYSIYPNNQSFSGSFELSLDMFVYNNGSSGTTEHGMAGLFLDNSDPVSPYEFGVEGGPLAWVFSGEGGDGSGDLGKYAEGNSSSTGYTALGDYLTFTPLPPGFDTQFGPALTGDSRGNWVDVTIRSTGDTIEFLLNGAVVDTYDNSGGFYTAGNILLGGMDVFNSANGGNGVIIDNVIVTPEPSSTLLTISGIAIAAIAFRRRGKGRI